MKPIFALVFFSVAFFSCDEESNNSQCKGVTISNDAFHSQAGEKDFQVLEHEIDDDCLKIRLQYSGCSEASVRLIASEDVAESSPPQRDVRFLLEGSGDCEKLITSAYQFDLTDLKMEGDRIILNVSDSELSIEYFY